MPKLSEFIEALQIIQKYNPESDFATDHDGIYVGDVAIIDEYITAEDHKRLVEDLGWFENEGSFYHFLQV